MRPIYRTVALIILILISFSFMGFVCEVDPKSKIAGTVYIDGRPQAYGTIQGWKDGELVIQERCTQTGHYTLAGLDAGTYILRYLNARGAQIGQDTTVEVRLGRFEQVDLELNVQTEGIPD